MHSKCQGAFLGLAIGKPSAVTNPWKILRKTICTKNKTNVSQLSAHTIMPIFLALPLEEQRAFMENAQKLLKKKDTPRKKNKTTIDRVCEQLGEMYRPGNEEMLIAHLMHSNK